MGLLERLETTETTAKSKVDAVFANSVVDDEYKAELLYALIDPKFPHTSIARELSKDGHPMSESAVRKYREKLSELVLANQEKGDE